HVAAADQSVAVTSSISIELVEMAGIGKWALSDAPIAKGYFENKSKQDLWDGGDIIDIYGRSGSKSVGGSILVDDITDNANAEIQGDAKVTTAPGGSLTLNASEDIFRISLVTAGGKTDDKGQFAVAGSVSVLVQDSNIYAGLDDSQSLGPTVTGGGALNIGATSGGFELEIVGTLVNAGKGSDALG